MTEAQDEPDIGCGIFALAQFATYIMCAIRWFATDHYSFWHGFKELIWALVPVVNFTYVWDWWFAFFGFLFVVGDALVNWLKGK